MTTARIRHYITPLFGLSSKYYTSQTKIASYKHSSFFIEQSVRKEMCFKMLTPGDNFGRKVRKIPEFFWTEKCLLITGSSLSLPFFSHSCLSSLICSQSHSLFFPFSLCLCLSLTVSMQKLFNSFYLFCIHHLFIPF